MVIIVEGGGGGGVVGMEGDRSVVIVRESLW